MKFALGLGIALALAGLLCTNLARDPPTVNAGVLTAVTGFLIAALAGIFMAVQALL